MLEIDNFYIVSFWDIHYNNIGEITSKELIKEIRAENKKDIRDIIKKEAENEQGFIYSVKEFFEYKQQIRKSNKWFHEDSPF